MSDFPSLSPVSSQVKFIPEESTAVAPVTAVWPVMAPTPAILSDAILSFFTSAPFCSSFTLSDALKLFFTLASPMMPAMPPTESLAPSRLVGTLSISIVTLPLLRQLLISPWPLPAIPPVRMTHGHSPGCIFSTDAHTSPVFTQSSISPPRPAMPPAIRS